jgi:hypothetical protein
LATKPEEAPMKAVVAPINVITNKAVGLYSNIGEHLNNRYKPAVHFYLNLIKLDYIFIF